MSALRWLSIIWFMLTLPSCVASPAGERATPAILRDSFTSGTPELAWHPYPYFNKDNLKGAIDPSSPEGEPGVGVLDNGTAGGFAALSYTDTLALEDFHLEAWLHVQVSEQEKGPLNGIAFHVMPSTTSTIASRSSSPPTFVVAGLRRQGLQAFPGHGGRVEGRGSSGRSAEAKRLARVVIEVKNHESRNIFGFDSTSRRSLPIGSHSAPVLSEFTRPIPAAAASPRPRSTASSLGVAHAEHVNSCADCQTDKLDATGFATFIPLTSCVMEFLLNKN